MHVTVSIDIGIRNLALVVFVCEHTCETLRLVSMRHVDILQPDILRRAQAQNLAHKARLAALAKSLTAANGTTTPAAAGPPKRKRKNLTRPTPPTATRTLTTSSSPPSGLTPKVKNANTVPMEVLENYAFLTLEQWWAAHVLPFTLASASPAAEAHQPPRENNWARATRFSVVIEQQIKCRYIMLATLMRTFFKLRAPQAFPNALMDIRYLNARYKTLLLPKLAPTWILLRVGLRDGTTATAQDIEGVSGHEGNKKIAVYHARCLAHHTDLSHPPLADLFLASKVDKNLDHVADALLQGLWWLAKAEGWTRLQCPSPHRAVLSSSRSVVAPVEPQPTPQQRVPSPEVEPMAQLRPLSPMDISSDSPAPVDHGPHVDNFELPPSNPHGSPAPPPPTSTIDDDEPPPLSPGRFETACPQPPNSPIFSLDNHAVADDDNDGSDHHVPYDINGGLDNEMEIHSKAAAPSTTTVQSAHVLKTVFDIKAEALAAGLPRVLPEPWCATLKHYRRTADEILGGTPSPLWD